ncbi:MAG: 8-oxoguanine DNA glycosylase, N-terminal domain-containing protein, partial [Holosporaceae bacterium]|nr:8-oxoguanine DNA glycosylase, N-terminal domain-containing protein [Holosporaceae bacterium]
MANSGQCFRMKETSESVWELIALNKRLQIQKEKNTSCYIFDCSRQDFEEIWFDYFDLGRDYGKIYTNRYDNTWHIASDRESNFSFRERIFFFIQLQKCSMGF